MENMRKVRKTMMKVLGYLIIFLFMMMTAVGSYQIITRYFFNRPSTVSEELLTYSFTWMSLLASAYVFGKRDHMRMGFMADKLTGNCRKYLEIIIVAPVARPFIKLIGNLKSVCTESIAASPTFPVNCPTITASTVVYNCWIRLPAISGSTKSNNAFPIFSEIRLSFFIIYCPFGTNGRQHCVHLPLPQVLDSLFCRYPYNAHIFPETGIPVEDPVGSEPHFQYSRLVWKSPY